MTNINTMLATAQQDGHIIDFGPKPESPFAVFHSDEEGVNVRLAEAIMAIIKPTKGTICRCGLAKSYHGPNPPILADHEYEPRYPRIADETYDREVENALVRRMLKAFQDTDLKHAVPGSALEHVYHQVYTDLMTRADRARKESLTS